MTVADLVVDRSVARYHLRRAQLEQRGRLDSILGTLFRDSPQLLSSLQVGADEEICIRSLEVTVRIRLDSSDSTLTGCWSAAIAEAVGRRLAWLADGKRSTNVVRYASRREAVLDLVRSISAGNREHAWAWKQLGLIRRSSPFGAELIVEALTSQPRLIVPVLIELARSEGIAGINRLLSGADYWTLAVAALTTAGVTRLPQELQSTVPSLRGRERAMRLARRSRIWLALETRHPERLVSDRHPAAIGILAVLETEPGLLMYDPARGFDVVSALAELSLQGPAPDTAAPQEMSSGVTDVAGQPAGGGRQGAGQHEVKSGANHGMDRPAQGAIDDGTGAEQPAHGEKASKPPGYHTEWGGLLFFLRLFDRLGLPEIAVTDGILGGRTLEWILHRLAISLIPAALDDAAVLAFAGLPPGSPPPEMEREPDVDELEALSLFRARLVDELRDVLERRLDDEAELLAEVTRREALIEGGPGWLVAHLPLATVSTDLRRAGLDLDPGYLPWLGLVIRFAYE